MSWAAYENAHTDDSAAPGTPWSRKRLRPRTPRAVEQWRLDLPTIRKVIVIEIPVSSHPKSQPLAQHYFQNRSGVLEIKARPVAASTFGGRENAGACKHPEAPKARPDPPWPSPPFPRPSPPPQKNGGPRKKVSEIFSLDWKKGADQGFHHHHHPADPPDHPAPAYSCLSHPPAAGG